MEDDFHQQRLAHLATINDSLPVLVTIPSNCGHTDSFEFLTIVFDGDGNFFETWRCHQCGQLHQIPYHPVGGLIL